MNPENARQIPELLAPAGDHTSLQAAIQGGCDAVYFGLDALNMRATAHNFMVADLESVAATCREHGTRAYLALNTMIFENELAHVADIIERAKPHIDAVICWDPAVIRLCGQHGIPIHISTQASVGNAEAACFYRDLGAQRIILARECSLTDILDIRNKSGVEIEVFIHGAMCLSLSGRCFLSQFTSGKSGNRGECQQNCRREYHLVSDDGKHEFVLGNTYALSARDLCTLPFIECLLDAGLDALKIEGRNRNALYVRTVVEAYRTAIDTWRDDALTPELKAALVERTRSVFNRGFSSGFYMGKPIDQFCRHMGSVASHSKDDVGIVANYYQRSKVAEILVQNHLFSVGDELVPEKVR